MAPGTLETTGHLMAQTCKLLRIQAHTRLDTIGLHRGQQFLLGVLWDREGLTHSEVARALHVQPATVTNMLKRMEKAGLVERRPDPEDARVSRVYLTERGRDIHGAFDEVWYELEELALAGFDPEEREKLGQMLLRIRENLLQEEKHRGANVCNRCDG